MVLDGEGDIRQCLETFWLLQLGEGGAGSCAPGIYQADARDVAKLLTVHRFQNKVTWLQRSIVPTLRNSDKEDPAENTEALGDGGAMIWKGLVSLNHNKRGFPPNIDVEVLDEFDVNSTEFSH